MIVNTSKECGRGILADELEEKVCTSRVLIDEALDIMDEAADQDQLTLLGLLLDYIPSYQSLPPKFQNRPLTALPRNNRQVIRIIRPCKLLLRRTESLKLYPQKAR